ncbi:MAG TPA: hypothetical protein PKV27_02065, partial [Ilumatobacteraceae bacterium]|nr:hypothetical protein [Ilumatobacteraceae bacterium]
HVRYLLPLTVLLALPAGVVCDLVMERRLGRVAVLVLFSLPLLQASRLVWLLRQEDTRAEAGLHALGLAQLRVRHYGDTARLEVPIDDFDEVIRQRGRIVQIVHGAGYRYVTLDLEGFRSGNLNPTGVSR